MPEPKRTKESLASKLKKTNRLRKLVESVWAGPQVDGITQSILSKLFVDPERFRILFIEGLREPEKFIIQIEYGQMWHTCEEHLASGSDEWKNALKQYALQLVKKYPLQREDILHWKKLCEIQFPLYVEYWKRNPDVKARKPFYQEETFEEIITLPSGRQFVARGKWDAVDIIENEYWIQENKSKSTVEVAMLSKQLMFDLQTMMYLVALQAHLKKIKKDHIPIGGVRYNVVRRPLSGGKGTIRKHKATKNKPAETDEAFYGRVRTILKDDPSHYYTRLKVIVSSEDIETFKHQCLFPVMENLIDSFEWWDYCINKEVDVYDYLHRQKQFPHHYPRHYRTPYGIYNTIAQGGMTEIDHYLANGSTIGLTRVTKLFTELV